MTTAIVVTKKSGQGIIPGVGAIQQFDLTIPTSWKATGVAVDLTDYFSTIDSVQIGGVVAGIGVMFQPKIPASGVALTVSNLLMLAYWSTDGAAAMTAVPDTTDIDGCTPLTITVIGKPAGEQ